MDSREGFGSTSNQPLHPGHSKVQRGGLYFYIYIIVSFFDGCLAFPKLIYIVQKHSSFLGMVTKIPL